MFTGQVPPTDCESTASRTGITRTTYDADWINVTDPALKFRKQRRDALSRVVEVVEDPSVLNYSTMYAYDALDNLTQVTQASQTRRFDFTSLSRLSSATNPESGLFTYTYYDSGDLNTRTDARGVVTTYTYDNLHRLKTKTYLNDPQSTPTAAYDYYLTGSAPQVGQLRSVKSVDPSTQSDISSTQYDAYDPLGRVTTTTQRVSGFTGAFLFNYTYWLNDVLKTIRYPSGRSVNYAVDTAGRLLMAYSDTKSYVDLRFATSPYLPYTADGRVAQMKLGNDLWETRDYRTPGTTTKFLVGTTAAGNEFLQLEYNYHATQNNGNLLGHGIVQPGKAWRQSFIYDGVNRVLCAAEALNTAPTDPCSQGTWHQTVGYDRYGNRWVSATPGLTGVDTHQPSSPSNFDAATNRLFVNNASYDAAGNQTRYEPWNISYDAENRIVSAVATPNASTGSGTFLYDAEGRRVKKMWTAGSLTNTTYYGYDLFGQLAVESSTQAPASMGTVYIHPDMLGSVRMVTGEKAGGTAPVLECYDYAPFGRMLNSGDNARNTGCYPPAPDTQLSSRLPQKFTGEERDPETRLDYFGARYLSAPEGRFLSADPPLIDQDPADPQSWNLYAYVRNNPLIYIDPNGQDCIYTDGFDEENRTIEVQRGNCRTKRGTFVEGTVDTSSITYDRFKRSLGYTYGTSSDSTIGAGVIDLSRRSDELDAKGLDFVTSMAARVNTSNEAMGAFGAATIAAGVGIGAYPYLAQAVNEWALGPSMGRLFFEGKLGYDAARAYGLGRTISDPNSPLGYLYDKWGQPLGRAGWQVLSRYWASGASGTVNMFPSFSKPNSLFWRVELPILLTNPNVFRLWH
jgi:RHS repeat-associated protein